MSGVQVKVLPFASEAEAMGAPKPRHVADDLHGTRVHRLGDRHVMPDPEGWRVENKSVRA